MTMDIRSDRLAVFLSVVEARGVSAAARLRGTAQSTVSQAVAALEESVGTPLLQRSGRELRLTEAGRLLATLGPRVLHELQSLQEALQGLQGVVAGRLRIGASDTLATTLLPSLLQAFRKKYPAVEVRLDHRPSPAIAAHLVDGALDIGVVSLPLPKLPGLGELTRITLAPDPVVAVCSRQFPLGKRRAAQGVTPKALAAYPLALLDTSTGLRVWLDAAFRRAGVTPTVVMESTSLEVLKHLVRLDFGVSVMPRSALRPGDRLRQLRLDGFPSDRRTAMLLPPGATRAARAFAELARTLVRGTATVEARASPSNRLGQRDAARRNS